MHVASAGLLAERGEHTLCCLFRAAQQPATSEQQGNTITAKLAYC
jgi:hypothetical protein